MDRRTVLKTGAALGIVAAAGPPAAAAGPPAGTAGLPPATADGLPAATADGLPAEAFAAQNRAPLQPVAYLRLKPGAVRAQGWLATQLEHQVTGLCGHSPEASHFLQYD